MLFYQRGGRARRLSNRTSQLHMYSMMMYQICEYIGCSAGFEFNASESVTSALSTQIIHNFDPTVSADHQDKVNVIALQQQQAPLVSKLPANLPQILNLSSEKGASLWLSALPKLKAFY